MNRKDRKIEVEVNKAENPIDVKQIAKAIAEQFRKDGEKNDGKNE